MILPKSYENFNSKKLKIKKKPKIFSTAVLPAKRLTGCAATDSSRTLKECSISSSRIFFRESKEKEREEDEEDKKKEEEQERTQKIENQRK